MAMIMGPRQWGRRSTARKTGRSWGENDGARTPSVEDGGAKIPHERDKGRKARLNHGAVVDGHGILRRKSHNEERHGDAVIEMGGNRAAALHRPAASLDDEVV